MEQCQRSGPQQDAKCGFEPDMKCRHNRLNAASCDTPMIGKPKKFASKKLILKTAPGYMAAVFDLGSKIVSSVHADASLARLLIWDLVSNTRHFARDTR
jgi:hypothetical protein